MDEITHAMDRNMAVQRAERSHLNGVDSDRLASNGKRLSEQQTGCGGGLRCCTVGAMSAISFKTVALTAILAGCATGIAGGDEAAWQPRPLALPATSENWQWSPPVKETTDPAPVAQIILPPPPPAPVEPEPEPTPAEIRQERIAQKRAEMRERSELEEASRSSYSLPPSDQINLGSRKSQLAEKAVEQLRLANWATKRGAIASAKAAAIDTLRTIAALRDAQIGDNSHTLALNECFDAVRESADFAGRYGPVDTRAIARLIEVHQTPALKQINTENLTSARAVEAYLNFAKVRLTQAVHGGPLAAEAALILADLEVLVSNGAVENSADHSSLHSAELALMYRRAAVEISPDNADAYAQLGRTLLRRSIPGAAKECLLASVSVQPTRQRVEALLEAAALSGDFLLVDQCEKQLAGTTLPSELPVQVMSPEAFARTSHPMPQHAMAQHSAPTQSFTPVPQPGFDVRVAAQPDQRHPHGQNQPRGPSLPTDQSQRSTGQILDPTLPVPPLAIRSSGRSYW
ncbi:hypothetical protein [Neorhodopirellula pilleata]|nr:hypothetical protein [Neorhodopirellula pilleata]